MAHTEVFRDSDGGYRWLAVWEDRAAETSDGAFANPAAAYEASLLVPVGDTHRSWAPGRLGGIDFRYADDSSTVGDADLDVVLLTLARMSLDEDTLHAWSVRDPKGLPGAIARLTEAAYNTLIDCGLLRYPSLKRNPAQLSALAMAISTCQRATYEEDTAPLVPPQSVEEVLREARARLRKD